jgi:putative transposase
MGMDWRSTARPGASEGREKKAPTAAILDSQSVKTAGQGGACGYDANKKIKGRKRHLLTDTLGWLLGVEITAASIPPRTYN